MPLNQISTRAAIPDDAQTIFEFICGLADYENESQAVETSAATINTQISADKPPFEALIAEVADTPVGLALFFENYSTWKGKRGIFLEDLYVLEDHRGAGVGTALLAALARITIERDGKRLDWQVLDWNEPSIKYYEAIGADIMRNWLPCRLEGQALSRMAER